MEEKRKHSRFNKQYVIKYVLKDNTAVSYDVTNLCDISKGGLKFFSYQNFVVGTKMILHIKFPYLYPADTHIEGEIVGNQEILKGKTCKVRVKFINVTPETATALEQMEKHSYKPMK